MDRFGPIGKVSKKTGPPFKVDHFFRLDRSDRKMTVPFDHSNPFSFPVPHGSVLTWFYHLAKNGGFRLPTTGAEFVT